MAEKKRVKRVLTLLGSPRKKGNSASLASAATRGAESAGAEVETVYLNGLKISACQGCGSCRKAGRPGCVQDDDMQVLYPKIAAADGFIIASPVYWFTMSAQTKLFMDRWYMFGADGYRALAGKRAAVVMSYGDEDPFMSGCVNALRSFQDAFRFVGIELAGFVYGTGDKPGDLAADARLQVKAEDLGRRLIEGDPE
jgi:multimeric flavodoxin WrbA